MSETVNGVSDKTFVDDLISSLIDVSNGNHSERSEHFFQKICGLRGSSMYKITEFILHNNNIDLDTLLKFANDTNQTATYTITYDSVARSNCIIKYRTTYMARNSPKGRENQIKQMFDTFGNVCQRLAKKIHQ